MNVGDGVTRCLAASIKYKTLGYNTIWLAAPLNTLINLRSLC